MENNTPRKVMVVSATESFLAKSLVDKLKGEELDTIHVFGDITELEKVRRGIELIILYMGEDLDEKSDILVYLKDMAEELDVRFVVIGDNRQRDTVTQIIPETLILEWFNRPLQMDKLLKCVTTFMEENTGNNRKRTILIVDDDITYMRTIYGWLKDQYHIGMAQNGAQAIGYLTRNKADLVLLDYEMPIINGPTVLQMLKSDDDTVRIPIMFLTGHGDRERVLSVVSLEPADYILKTITREQLLEKLNKFFEKQAPVAG